MSRGYDGPEIDDFRDSSWERDRDTSRRDTSPRRVGAWETREGVRLKLQRLREEESKSDQAGARTRENPENNRPTLAKERRQVEAAQDRDREEYADRDRTYSLRPSEIHTLAEVGKFRVVAVKDLLDHAYGSHRARMESDVQNLRRQGLVEQRDTSPLKKESRQVLCLSKEGQHLIRRHGFVSEDQAIYSGFVKPKEADHDADLYRVFQKTADEIERNGGKVLRVQLDYELKEKLY